MLLFEMLERRDLCTVSPFDVNLDGRITPADVIVEIGNANAGLAAPIDVLRIINHINAYGNNTQGEFPIVGVLPAGETLGRIQYDATRPTQVEIAVFSTWLPICDAVLIDSNGSEIPGEWSKPGTGFERWTFRPIVAGVGVLSLHGTIEPGNTRVWSLTTFWDTLTNRPVAKGLNLTELV